MEENYELFSQIFNEVFSMWANEYVDGKIRMYPRWKNREETAMKALGLFDMVSLSYEEDSESFILRSNIVNEDQYPESTLVVNEIASCFLYSETRVSEYVHATRANITLSGMAAEGICDLCVFVIHNILGNREFLHNSTYRIHVEKDFEYILYTLC
jgi:hypothetical protein